MVSVDTGFRTKSIPLKELEYRLALTRVEFKPAQRDVISAHRARTSQNEIFGLDQRLSLKDPPYLGR